MKISLDDGVLVCPYRCIYSDDGICCGSLMQCCHLKERAKVCLEDTKESFELLQRYASEDDDMYEQRNLRDMKESIRKYEKILRADKIDVIVKPSGQSYYKTVIDACVERKLKLGNIVVQYANGIGVFTTGFFITGELYGDDIYYYEMKYIMDCYEIPSRKIVLHEKNSTLCFDYNPIAQEEGKPLNFSYDGEDIYGTVVFYKQIEKEDGNQIVSLEQRDISYIENLLDRALI